MPTFQTSPGTRDILPPDSGRWRALVDQFESIATTAGYQCIILPMFEDLGVFQRIGESTDVVTKEMYDFEDKGGRRVALRPEHTAGVCRSYAQHRPTPPWKVWYAGSNFRYEKPQAGRYRQFDQVGLEALGVDDPMLDAEVIALAWRFFRALGLRNLELVVNSLGDAGDRERYVAELARYLGGRADELSEDARKTLDRNPLRVLDSKRAEDILVVADAPRLSEFLSDGARTHFESLTSALRALSIPHRVDPFLVRGLDYYVRTTFEFRASSLESSQNAVGGGGRYDGLVEALGGPETPGVGFALGVDRTLLACDAEGCFESPSSAVDVFVVDTVDGLGALRVTEELRSAGISSDRSFGGRSMKSQMKAADRSGAGIAVIIGADESASGSLTIRDMRTSGQSTIPFDDLVATVRSMVSSDVETGQTGGTAANQEKDG